MKEVVCRLLFLTCFIGNTYAFIQPGNEATDYRKHEWIPIMVDRLRSYQEAMFWASVLDDLMEDLWKNRPTLFFPTKWLTCSRELLSASPVFCSVWSWRCVQ